MSVLYCAFTGAVECALSKETYIYEKRPVNTSKHCQKRPTCMKMRPIRTTQGKAMSVLHHVIVGAIGCALSKETYIYEKRPVNMSKHCQKRPTFNEMRPIRTTQGKLMSVLYNVIVGAIGCALSKETCIYEKRPVNMSKHCHKRHV